MGKERTGGKTWQHPSSQKRREKGVAIPGRQRFLVPERSPESIAALPCRSPAVGRGCHRVAAVPGPAAAATPEALEVGPQPLPGTNTPSCPPTSSQTCMQKFGWRSPSSQTQTQTVFLTMNANLDLWLYYNPFFFLSHHRGIMISYSLHRGHHCLIPRAQSILVCCSEKKYFI